MTTKETNPKDVVGVKKWSLSYVPARVLAALSVAMMEGGMKYGSHNQRVAGVRAMVYWDAAIRHLFAWKEGEDIDPESNLNHVVKTIASLVVLLDGMLGENWQDDRPVAVKEVGKFFKDLDKIAVLLAEKYPEPVAPYTQLDQSWTDAAAERIVPRYDQPTGYWRTDGTSAEPEWIPLGENTVECTTDNRAYMLKGETNG